MVMKNKTQIGRERRRGGFQLDEPELQDLQVQHCHQFFPSPLLLLKLGDGIGYLQLQLLAKKPQQHQTQIL
jgi:hypothetical protein